jgi:superfamily I DNA/RNA helicase
MKNCSIKKYIGHLILDEAQDFPSGLMELLNMVSKKVTVFGDPNQAIFNKTTTSDFTHCFDAGGKVYYLSKNYRNTREIAEVGRLFYTGEPDDIPAMSKRTGLKPTYYGCDSFEEMLEVIANYADNNPSESIGVLLPGVSNVWSKLKAYTEALRKETSTPVQCYISGNKKWSEEFSFLETGVKVMSFGTAKGLEFDAVFLPEINSLSIDSPENTQLCNSIYVAATRAKDSLFFIGLNNLGDNFVTKMLRNNEELLSWIE